MTSILRSRQFRDADHLVIAAVLGIAVLGMLTLRSIPGAGYKRQFILFIVSMVFFLGAASIDYGFLRHSWMPLYWSCAALLAIVLVFGKVAGGRRQWLMMFGLQIQPSEFAKVILIGTLAVYAAQVGDRIRDPIEVAYSFVALTALPLLLVLAQGDMGTALVLIAIWLGILYFAGANLWHLLIFVLAGLMIAKLLWDWGLMPGYRVQRVLAWLDPHAYLDPDTRMPGLQYLRSWQAIGAGGMWGQGYQRGWLTQFPTGVPAQETDMTFSALAEEMGFVFGAALVLLYGIVVWRGLGTVAQTQNDLGRYIAAGVVSYLAFEAIVNLAMNVGLLPITGIPLPLFSRGGSNLIATMVALGLLVNVHLRRRRITFEATM